MGILPENLNDYLLLALFGKDFRLRMNGRKSSAGRLSRAVALLRLSALMIKIMSLCLQEQSVYYDGIAYHSQSDVIPFRVVVIIRYMKQDRGEVLFPLLQLFVNVDEKSSVNFSHRTIKSFMTSSSSSVMRYMLLKSLLFAWLEIMHFWSRASCLQIGLFAADDAPPHANLRKRAFWRPSVLLSRSSRTFQKPIMLFSKAPG